MSSRELQTMPFLDVYLFTQLLAFCLLKIIGHILKIN